MGCQVSRLHEPLEGQLGLHQPDVQVLADRSAVMDTTNAIESLNRGRTAFPNAVGLTKALYRELTKKWTSPFEIGGRSTRSWPFCIPAG